MSDTEHLLIVDGHEDLALGALADGRDYLLPDDVKSVAVPVLSHRLILAPEARADALAPEDVVREALTKTPVPV